MAELADAYGSGPYGSNTMRVQVSFPASIQEAVKNEKSFFTAPFCGAPKSFLQQGTVLPFMRYVFLKLNAIMIKQIDDRKRGCNRQNENSSFTRIGTNGARLERGSPSALRVPC